MALSNDQKEKIKNLLRTKIQSKLNRYARESTYMPFLVRLIQDEEKVAAYSFIHSVATMLGMSIYEEIAKIVTEPLSEEVGVKIDIGGTLSDEQLKVIEKIVSELRDGKRQANKEEETKEVLKASSVKGKSYKKDRIADFFMKRNGKEYYFEIKTVKPNIDVFTISKIKLLQWIARKQKPIITILAFPYNPYHPQPYTRFTEQGVIDKEKELLVGKEFWDFLGDDGTYEELLNVFDEVGREFKEKLLQKIKEVAEKQKL
ncbi:MAG: TdeIII family type II restriction endonuclease [Candidatus Parcubacteria bacterium]|nr:MAG: TdeIII family type II restriction endonuclease [Candidatus Parcubacteria bacterium]